MTLDKFIAFGEDEYSGEFTAADDKLFSDLKLLSFFWFVAMIPVIIIQTHWAINDNIKTRRNFKLAALYHFVMVIIYYVIFITIAITD